MTDRIEALSTYRADPVKAHSRWRGSTTALTPRIDSVQRAQAIAQFDFMRGSTSPTSSWSMDADK